MRAAALALDVAEESCLHCGESLPLGAVDAYCCRGCRTVATLLESQGLSRFYDLRGARGVPVAASDRARSLAWLEPVMAQLGDGPTSLEFDLQGVHCAACVWLLETLFERRGVGRIEVNPALGRARLVVDASFPLADYVRDAEALGYRFGPAEVGATESESDALLLKAGVALALAGNGMMLSAAIHLGLPAGPLHSAATHLSFACACIAMSLGGPIFFRSAYEGLRRGALHLDLPIAVGMGLAFAGSTWSYLVGLDANYVDTLTAFVALMLLGRWLKSRVLERNRRELLRDPGFEGLLVRRTRGSTTELVTAQALAVGDRVVVAPGDVVPCRGRLEDAAATFTSDWIDGESVPRELARGAEVPAGAVVAGDAAAQLTIVSPFETSLVWRLVSAHATAREERTLAGIPANVGALYVAFVFVASALVFGLTFARSGTLSEALELTTAALVVTCPCAFGIAVPLAYEVVQARLRRRGVFVQHPSLFDRALGLRHVVFDKTGTLTTGHLVVGDPSTLARLPEPTRATLYDLACRSSHPKSRAVARALEERGEARYDATVEVRETRGGGLSTCVSGVTYKLGSAAFTGVAGEGCEDLFFSRDGLVVARIALAEEVRPEVAAEVTRLEALGLTAHVASGDTDARCEVIADRLGIARERVHGGMAPEAKRALVTELSATATMMIGDGLNDAEALALAGCSGTPSIDRPFTASRCDFYFVTPGLDPVRHVVEESRRLSRVVRADLALAVLYNVVAVGLCAAGLMRPWLAALFMPGSSLATVLFTVAALGGKRR